ncbi:MAG: type II toxin-antitoxin system RelB/DinJ family antitoxin [Ruminococcaceae bacterium]|nr:type II toxin-antitoxin system RelB/DinJ family antitoxin [Oscillospiraceae bacterium]
MAAVSTNIKIDPTLKQESQALFESLGLSLSTAVNMFLRQAVREQAIPFRIGMPIPNTETMKAIEDARNGIGLSRGFSSVSELMEDHDADD